MSFRFNTSRSKLFWVPYKWHLPTMQSLRYMLFVLFNNNEFILNSSNPVFDSVYGLQFSAIVIQYVLWLPLSLSLSIDPSIYIYNTFHSLATFKLPSQEIMQHVIQHYITVYWSLSYCRISSVLNYSNKNPNFPTAAASHWEFQPRLAFIVTQSQEAECICHQAWIYKKDKNYFWQWISFKYCSE